MRHDEPPQRGDLTDGEFDALVGALQGDAAAPLDVDLPYADETCDLDEEIAHAHGQAITGLAYGADCFNFCFPRGMELETWLVPARDGRKALRVFWEQW